MKNNSKRHTIVGISLIFFIVVITLWEVMSSLTTSPWAFYDLSEKNFIGFLPKLSGWKVKRIPINIDDPLEPNIVAVSFENITNKSTVILSRLVHGYNARDCMRIKGYSFELITNMLTKSEHRVQVWNVISPADDRSIWLTGILKAGDYKETDLSILDMAFPRVGIPDDPNWVPKGINKKSLKHPIANFKKFVRERWNGSRCDILVFLRLKRPQWASEEDLTLLSVWKGGLINKGDEANVERTLLKIYENMLSSLHDWNE